MYQVFDTILSKAGLPGLGWCGLMATRVCLVQAGTDWYSFAGIFPNAGSSGVARSLKRGSK